MDGSSINKSAATAMAKIKIEATINHRRICFTQLENVMSRVPADCRMVESVKMLPNESLTEKNHSVARCGAG